MAYLFLVLFGAAIFWIGFVVAIAGPFRVPPEGVSPRFLQWFHLCLVFATLLFGGAFAIALTSETLSLNPWSPLVFLLFIPGAWTGSHMLQKARVHFLQSQKSSDSLVE